MGWLGKRSLWLIPAALLPLPVTAADAEESVLIEGVAAYVNEHVITIGDIMMLLEPMHRQLRERYDGRELRARLRRAYEDARQALIERKLILDAYEKQERKLPESVIEERVDAVVNERFGGDESELMDALRAERMTVEQWRGQVREQVIVKSMRQAYVDRAVEVAPRAVRLYYEEHPEDFRRPARVRVRMMVFKPGDGGREAARAAAERARAKLREGADFAELAKEVSDGSKAGDGGDWGWMEPDMLRAELAGVVEGLEPGETSDVVETADACYLLRLEARRPAQEESFEEAQGRIERAIRKVELERAYREWIDRLAETAYVESTDVHVF